MKHYFHFKKGQMVPQWLLRQRDADTKEVLPMAQFRVSGKVMVDDETGEAIVWPASKRYQYLIYVYGCNRSVLLDTDDSGSRNRFFTFGSLSEWSLFNQWKIVRPLVRARRDGHKVYTTTKCKPLPDNFDRREGVL